ncbi:MAG: hypothetical protein Q9221_008935 [Calogaya cf. arnoldii]
MDLVSMREAGWASNTVDDVTSELRNEGPHTIWDKLTKWELEKIDYVHDYLMEMSMTEESDSNTSPYLVSMPVIKDQPVALPASYPVDDEQTDAWDQSELHLNRQNTAVRLMRILRNQNDSPLRGCDFKPLWRLGFWIWDTKRLVTLGLIAMPNYIREQNEQGLEELLSSSKLDLFPTRVSISRDDSFTRWKSVWLQGVEI